MQPYRFHSCEMVNTAEELNQTIVPTAACPAITSELLWYKQIHGFLTILLGEVKDAIIEFFNIPVALVKVIVDLANQFLSVIEDSCDKMIALISSAKDSAAYENSRLVLQEVACRTTGPLNKGSGCDGVDNDCNAQADECDEGEFTSQHKMCICPPCDVHSFPPSMIFRCFPPRNRCRDCSSAVWWQDIC